MATPAVDRDVIPVLETPRLRLRGWRASDREPFAAMNADPEVTRYLSKPLTREESDAFVDRIVGRWRERGYGLWAVERRSDGAFLGFTGLSWQDFESPVTPAIEIGWRLRRDAWGHGYATEAARAALRYAFEELALDEIVSFTTAANTASRRVMERIGLVRDAAADFELPSVPPDHPIRPHIVYRLTRAGWAAMTQEDRA
jgi:RimJ/RimL family protein N-acetyltransferase